MSVAALYDVHGNVHALEAAAAAIRASSFPNAEAFAAESVLQVPSREEAREFLSR